jgi:hypothetical protein
MRDWSAASVKGTSNVDVGNAGGTYSIDADTRILTDSGGHLNTDLGSNDVPVS